MAFWSRDEGWPLPGPVSKKALRLVQRQAKRMGKAMRETKDKMVLDMFKRPA